MIKIADLMMLVILFFRRHLSSLTSTVRKRENNARYIYIYIKHMKICILLSLYIYI